MFYAIIRELSRYCRQSVITVMPYAAATRHAIMPLTPYFSLLFAATLRYVITTIHAAATITASFSPMLRHAADVYFFQILRLLLMPSRYAAGLPPLFDAAY